MLSARIAALIEELKAEPAWDEEDRNSKTVFKAAGMRVVLVGLRKGAVVAKHQADAPLTIQVVEGQVEVRAGDEDLTLLAGALLHLAKGVPHELRALGDAALLLTLGGRA